MDISKIKLPIGIIFIVVVQAFGIIWYMAQLDSTVSNLDQSVTHMQEEATTTEDRIAELETKDAIIENEMRTIMSEHNSFGDILRDMGQSGYGDTRSYGNYG